MHDLYSHTRLVYIACLLENYNRLAISEIVLVEKGKCESETEKESPTKGMK